MQLIKTEDGQIINVIESVSVTREDLSEQVDKALAAVKEAEANLIEFDKLDKPAEPTPESEPDTPAEQAAEIAESAADLAEDLAAVPAPAPAPEPAPADTPAPATPPVAEPTAPIIVQ